MVDKLPIVHHASQRTGSSGLSTGYRCRCARCLALLAAALATAAVEPLEPLKPVDRACLAGGVCAIEGEMLPPWTPHGWEGSEVLQPTTAEIGLASGGRQVSASAAFSGGSSLVARANVARGAALASVFEPPWPLPEA
jgi:hypothetical protein